MPLIKYAAFFLLVGCLILNGCSRKAGPVSANSPGDKFLKLDSSVSIPVSVNSFSGGVRSAKAEITKEHPLLAKIEQMLSKRSTYSEFIRTKKTAPDINIFITVNEEEPLEIGLFHGLAVLDNGNNGFELSRHERNDLEGLVEEFLTEHKKLP